ncbi:putative disease resistance protein RGA4 [Gossypium arboreum]|uniref:putative disease resistance protein RGA4 n=1 Tax=Gossypium arboreum TaxID=29729 RepID=UPI0022F166C1|nr:putative disease resistance protein RGA4 [Gossypium arboreum]
MADSLVSALLNTIFDNLNSLSREGIRLAGSLKTEVQTLESTLTTIQAVLHDAEQKQWKTYDLEDVLDDFNAEALRQRDARSNVTVFFSPQNPLLFRLNMAHKLKDAREKLDAIAEERSKFHLREGVAEAETGRNRDRITSSLVNESEVIGRGDEKAEIVSMLLKNVNHHDDLSVYAICGMGGLGKTTIAQLVYNDENVTKVFDLRAWVCVSDDFDIASLTKPIVESIEQGNACNIQQLDPLQRCLLEKLAGKRFLLVLDDVWNEHEDKWDGLKKALLSGQRGSTVIVTTRLKKVALMMATIPVHDLVCFSDDDSWSLFKQRAFGMGMDEGNVNLERIGRQIVQRCGGLPLAIKATGSILRFKSQERESLRVKESEIWDLEDEGRRILDYVMEKDKLIGLWTANGFIPSRGHMDLHDAGCEILSELTWRSFLQDVKEDVHGTVTCKMHDLVHDLATSMMDECYVIEPSERLKIPKTARHLFVHSSSFSRNTLDLSELQPLLSLILGNKFTFRGIANLYNPSHFISKQKHLKVLDLGYNFCNIAFKSLNNLRYLCLHDGNMKTLPESTSSLHNLQTLNLRSCDNLQMLPTGMKHLENLRYLDLRECYKLSSMPIGLGQLSSLRKLNKFVVGKDNDSGGIDELKYLSWRRDSNETSQHGNDEEILNALQPHSCLKKLYIYGYQGVRFPYWMMDMLLPNLVQISLEYCNRCDQLPPLGKLRFLKVLTIFGMGALKYIDSNFNGDMESSFPSLEVLKILWAPCLEEWTADNGRQHFPILTSSTIIGCPMLVKLPMLQSLKELDIRGSSVTLLKSSMMNATVLISLHIWEFYELRDLSDLLDNT